MAVLDVMKALSDPVRWDIFVQIAARSEIGNSELTATAEVSKPTMSYHLRILKDAGLIELRKEGRHHFYRVRREHGLRLVEAARAELSMAPTAKKAPARRPGLTPADPRNP